LELLSVTAVGALDQGNRAIEANRSDCSRIYVYGTFAGENRLPANEEEHHGRQPDEGQALVQYLSDRSQLPQQALRHCGGVHVHLPPCLPPRGPGPTRIPAAFANRA
jgi:hypothetical protein